MSRLNIAMVSEHASPLALLGGTDAGGQNVYVDRIARELGRLGNQVDVFTRADSDSLSPIVQLASSVRVVNVPAGPMRELPKDNLWPHMPEFLESIRQFAAHQAPPYDVIHGNFWMSGWVGTQLKRSIGAPLVQIFHAMGKTKMREQGTADTSPPSRLRVEYQVIASADALIAQCPAERYELVEEYGAPPNKVQVIPSAVDPDRYRPLDVNACKQRLGLDPERAVVGYIGRLQQRKDVANIIRAVGLVRRRTSLDPLLMVVGGETQEPDVSVSPELGRLIELAEQEDIAGATWFTGKRQPDVLSQYYGACDVVVTTPWYEPFGLTPLEAMACARPVIGSAVGGIQYTVRDQETGLLVPPRDPYALATALERLLSDPQLRRSMGSAARQRVESQFCWPLAASRTLDLYREVLATRSYPVSLEAAGIAV
jgi:D-inositol-3-phosphate glycosyltransferase